MATKIHQEYFDESILPSKGKKKKGKRQGTPKITFNIRENLPLLSYIGLGIFLFLFFLFLKLPLERFSSNILQIASSKTQMDWQAQDMNISFIFGPKVTFQELTITALNQNSTVPDDALSKIIGESITIEKLSIRPSLWRLIPIPWIKDSEPAGSFTMQLFQSTISGNFIASNKLLYINIESDQLDLKNIPGIQRLVTVYGKLEDFNLEISMPFQRMSMANGEINFKGDKLRLDIASLSQASFIKNIGIVNLGKINLKSSIKGGLLQLKEFSLAGKDNDLEAKLDGDVKLNDRIDYSNLNLTLSLIAGAKVQPIMENPLLSSLIPFEKKPNNNYVLRMQGALSQPSFGSLVK